MPADGETGTPSARSRLLSVLGETAWPAGGTAWTSSLLHVTGLLGIEERAARQAIARAASAGWITPERRGRATRWTLSPRLEHAYETGATRVASLAEPFEEWSGEWLSLVVTIPHEQRDVRKRLYRRLRWEGLGSPWAGLWLTPHVERSAAVGDLVDELGLRGSSVLATSRIEPFGLRHTELVERSWELSEVAHDYAAVDRSLRGLDPITPDDTVVALIRASEELQRFSALDPQLPEALLPRWQGRPVARRLLDRRAGWAPVVRARWLELEDAARG